MKTYAPYAAYCFEVDLYFYLCLTNGIISDQRPSHRIDIAYLYYLPFVRIFVSGDKLHRTSAPLFMTDQQSFVWSADLKSDLAVLNEEFLALPENQKAKGLFTLVTSPPKADQGLCARLWDKHAPGWRNPKVASNLSPEKTREIIEGSKAMQRAAVGGEPLNASHGIGSDQVDRLLIKRHLPRQRGSWRMMAKEVEDAEDASEDRDN